MNQELTPVERYYLQKTSTVGDPLEVKSFVLGLPLEKREDACSSLLEYMYQRRHKHGQSNLLAARILFEDPRILFKPSDELLNRLAAWGAGDKDVVKYMVTQGMPVLVPGTQNGALRQACIEKDSELVKFLLACRAPLPSVGVDQRVQLVSALINMRGSNVAPLSYASSEKALEHLRQLNKPYWKIFDILLRTDPKILLTKKNVKDILKNNAPAPYLVYLVDRKEVGLELLIKTLLSVEGKGIEQAQRSCEYLYNFMPKQVCHVVSQHEGLYGKLEQSYCPMLYAHTQKKVMLGELKGKGVVKAKPKM